MRNLESARKLLAGRVEPLPAVELSLVAAVGCRLAQTPRSDIDLPAADVSTMDGYAVRNGDLASEAALPVAFEVPAGQAPPPLPPGTTARIFTGAVVPNGADTVVPQEQAEVRTDGTVRLDVLAAGSFIRRQGELISAGAGRRTHPAAGLTARRGRREPRSRRTSAAGGRVLDGG